MRRSYEEEFMRRSLSEGVYQEEFIRSS